MPVFVDKCVTGLPSRRLLVLAGLLVVTWAGRGQSADSLKKVRRVSVGSLGQYAGAEELRRELIRYLERTREFEVVGSQEQADAVLDGKGELWIRGYQSLSPRARANPSYAEAVYGGYLSVKLHGKDDEILWSYFADPRRVSFRNLKRDLVDEVVHRLVDDRSGETNPPPAAKSASDAPATVRGAGATFPFPIYQEWFKSFHARHAAWSFEYSAVGSEAGIQQLGADQIDFAGTDIPPSALRDRIPHDSNSFPTVGGAVVLIYNLPRFTGELRLTGGLIAGIFSGRIRSWSDPGLAAVNASAGLPDKPIETFHRSDGSGTTFAFTDYLSKVDAGWRQKIGTGARPAWASGKGVRGNAALAQAVAATPYSLGYVEFIYAFDHHLGFASIRNASGRFIQPDLLSIMAAANQAGDKEEYLSLSITDPVEANAYPISTVSWMVVPTIRDVAKKAATIAFLEWMLTSGQRQCSAVGYAPLPRNLVDRELSAVRKMR